MKALTTGALSVGLLPALLIHSIKWQVRWTWKQEQSRSRYHNWEGGNPVLQSEGCKCWFSLCEPSQDSSKVEVIVRGWRPDFLASHSSCHRTIASLHQMVTPNIVRLKCLHIQGKIFPSQKKKKWKKKIWSPDPGVSPPFSRTKGTTSIPSAERWEGCYFWDQKKKIPVAWDCTRNFPHVQRLQESTHCWEPLILDLVPRDSLSKLFWESFLYDSYDTCM